MLYGCHYLRQKYHIMDFTPPLQHGRLIKRYKRFLTDIILDDGSHMNDHVTYSFQHLFDSVKPPTYTWFVTLSTTTALVSSQDV